MWEPTTMSTILLGLDKKLYSVALSSVVGRRRPSSTTITLLRWFFQHTITSLLYVFLHECSSFLCYMLQLSYHCCCWLSFRWQLMQLGGCTVKVLLLFISMDDLLVAVVAGSSLTHSFLELRSLLSSINTFLFASLYPPVYYISFSISWLVGMSSCFNDGVARWISMHRCFWIANY